MLTIQRSDSLRRGEGCNPSSTHLLDPVISGASVTVWKPAERSVSFNRDVHVKRIGHGAPCITATYNTQQPSKLSLPGRHKKRPELPLDVKLGGGEETDVAANLGTSVTKKKPLQRSASDGSSKKLKKGSLARLFSPKSEKRRKPVNRSASDAGPCMQARLQRKRSGSESDASHLSSTCAKKPLSPIIEASPQTDQQQPFHFNVADNNRPRTKKSKQKQEEKVNPTDVDAVTSDVVATEATEKIRTVDELAGRSSVEEEESEVVKHRIFIEDGVFFEVEENHEKEEEGKEQETVGAPPPAEESAKRGNDEADGENSMLRNSRCEQSTIRKMIHRLSDDRSPPPQLTRTMVSPSPAFTHNSNRPFSYTRPNDSNSQTPVQTTIIYAQIQQDKKKSQRSYSDSDEGLGLDRKESSRENSPAEKEYRRTDYSYNSDLRRNKINSCKSRYVEERREDELFGKQKDSSNEARKHDDFEEIDKQLYDKPEKHSSTVDTSGRGRADGMDARRRDSGERPGETGISNKTSELSARRDLLESRIKSRLLADEMFAAKSNSANVLGKKSGHEIIDKPIVPSPVTPSRVASPKRYTDTYITETRINSNGERSVFEKKIRDNNGKVYGYEKKITNVPTNGSLQTSKPRSGYTVQTKTNKYGDKYIIETQRHEGCVDDLKPVFSDRNRQEDRFLVPRDPRNSYKSSQYLHEESNQRGDYDELSSPIIAKKLNERKFSKSENFLDRESQPFDRQAYYYTKPRKNYESIRGMSKSTQRLDEVGENNEPWGRAFRNKYTTRSHENLSSIHGEYVNARDMRRRSFLNSPGREKASYTMRHLDCLREGSNDEYDTDISHATNNQLETKYHKETRTMHRYSSKKYDDYDSSPPRIRPDRGGGYSSSRYDSDTTTRDSTQYENRYNEISHAYLHKEHDRKNEEDTKKKRSRNRLNYLDDSNVSRGDVSPGQMETFQVPIRPPRAYHHDKSQHGRQEMRGHIERRYRENRFTDPDRKDRLADSGIENDFRRDSQDVDKREPFESEDESLISRQFIKYEKRHTDYTMNLTPSEYQKYEKYSNDSDKQPLTAKPPSGTDKKYEKTAKKSGTMNKMKQFFSKKEKKSKEDKSKKNTRNSGVDDEVTTRYREYRGDQLRGTKTSRDLVDFNPLVDKKPRIPESEILTTGTEDEEASSAPERVSVQKNLRFFGDTDQESVSSNRERRYQRPVPETRSKSADNHASSRRDATGRHDLSITSMRKSSRLAESALSSGESTTGDSSQRSQNSQRSLRSVVYLHAATVGEIPGPNEQRRAASREEFSRPLQPHTRTVSRSVSVLAPWKPRHYREPFEINYDQQQQYTKSTTRRRQRSHETLNRRGKEARRNKDKDVSKTGTMSRKPEEKNKSLSTNSLITTPHATKASKQLNKSTSLPRNTNKGAGWLNIKSKISRA
ncbi:PREDICTED: uncharacterized protein LOC106740754 isoform X2 [Dinoponera quadriceps]|uniref:Uncharacterized protein LOC106740754 isoform X2 n=1 Tax=Dinoponera quadriceps TaxID=609295 RepID=A0A6P3WNF6_DINQU|nr:PREDICTED: uncharacterized protein LOC106740754 isoform X2 [Dinoponera quadriceps]